MRLPVPYIVEKGDRHPPPGRTSEQIEAPAASQRRYPSPRELDQHLSDTLTLVPAVVGAGRLGTLLVRELARAGDDVRGPLGRDYDAADVAGAGIVLLCVPDREIAVAAATLAERADEAPIVGHCSGAIGLEPLRPFADAFSLHPLMTFAANGHAPSLSGATAAIDASSPAARAAASELAAELGLAPVEIAPADRALYHAAASVASNFLVTLEAAAERLAAAAGLERAALVPLVRQTVENWARDGRAALTGPIARGDEDTVARQRDAVAAAAPDLVAMFDALAEATRGGCVGPSPMTEHR